MKLSEMFEIGNEFIYLGITYSVILIQDYHHSYINCFYVGDSNNLEVQTFEYDIAKAIYEEQINKYKSQDNKKYVRNRII